MKALVYGQPTRPVNAAKFAASVVAGALRPGAGAKVGPLSLRDVEPPELPGPDWVRVKPRLSGICGSDLATLDGKASRYFEPIVSFPFVPGHEIVGELDDGSRVVVIPVLHCAVRGIDPPCPACLAGQVNRCERLAYGHLEPGLQCGYCESTGGGWSTLMVAHRSQVVPVPDDLTDEAAVLVEPTACAVHVANVVRATEPDAPSRIAVIGSGTLGLLTIAALRQLVSTTEIVATAKHPDQRSLARELGADVVTSPGALERTIRSATGSMMLGDQLTGGTPQVVDCVGSEESLRQALRTVAPGGTVHLVGMPGVTTLDLTSVWHREVALRGCYAYEPADFHTAIDLVRDLKLERLLTRTYPLDRYQDAVAHAANAGARGAVKIAFDLRDERERKHL